MMRLSGVTATKQAGLGGDELEMCLIAITPGLAYREHALVDVPTETAAESVDLATIC